MDDTLLSSNEPDDDRPALPRKTSPAIAAENRLASIAWPVMVELCETTIVCEVAEQTPPDLNSFLRAAVRIDDHPAELFIAPQLYQGLAALIDEEALADDLDVKIRALLLEAGMVSDLERLENTLGWRVAFEQVHPTQDRKSVDLFWLDVTLEDETSGLLGLALPPSHLEQLAAHLAAEEPAEPVETERAPLPLGITLALRAGSMVLGLADLKSVRPGDILLMDDSLIGASKIAVVGGRDGWLFDARLDHDGVTLSSGRRAPHSRDRDLWLMDDLNQEQETDETAEHDGQTLEGQNETVDAPTLDELPIKLLFELGQVQVSLGELETLGPGHVFDLDKDLQKSVDIRAAGKRIGKGEIVEIDGRLGVRIGRLFDHA